MSLPGLPFPSLPKTGGITGFALPVLAIGLGSIYVKAQRGFYPQPDQGQGPLQPMIAQVTIEEIHHDVLEITDHPVERGASISDHAYKRPAEVVIRCAWSNSPSNNPSSIIGSAVSAATGLASTLLPGGAIAAAAQPTLNGLNAVGSALDGNGPSQASQIYANLLKLQSSAVLFDIYTGKRVYKDMLFKSITVTTDKNSENSLMLTIECRQILLTSTRLVNLRINSSAQSNPEKTMPVQNAGNQSLLNVSSP